jgi:hypothetical protein
MLGASEECADFLQSLAAKHFPFDGPSPPLIVVEQDPFRTVQFLEDSVFGAQVLDGFLLLVVDPAGQDGEEELPGFKEEIHGRAIIGKCVATAFTIRCSIW